MTLILIQCCFNAGIAFLGLQFSTQPKHLVPIQEYAKCSFTFVGAMASSNYALTYVNYPTQVLAKSCKMIPVMLMRILVNGKVYTLKEYMNVILMTFGISLFFLSAPSKGGADNGTWIGYGLCILSLIMDAFTGPHQEHLNDVYKPSVNQLQWYLNVFAIGISCVGIIIAQELTPCVNFLQAYPSILLDIFVFSVLSSIGQYMILYTLLKFNSLVVTIITTSRKFFTIIASVLWFAHPIHYLQKLGVVAVFVGLSMNIYEKYQESLQKKKMTTQ